MIIEGEMNGRKF